MAVLLDDMTAILEDMQGYKPDYSLHPRVDETRILVASDMHIPYHHIPTVRRFLEYADKHAVDAVLHLGDLMDNPTYSSWGNEDLHTTFDDELEQVEMFIRLVSEMVPVQYWSLGNHERRWMRANGYQTDMRRLALMADLGDLMDSGKLVVSDDPTLDYYSSDGEHWMLTHPSQYGNTPLKVPGDLAERFGCNLISAHAHHWGMGTSPSGRYTVIESGGLFDADKVKYVQHRVTTHRAWVRGFVLLDDGNPTLIRG